MAMKQIRGFRIRLIKWAFHEKQTSYSKLKPTSYTRVCKFGRSLTRKLKELWFFNSFSNYDRIGSERFDEKTRVPKGHLAVYFGEEDDDVCRVLVPVVYLNHPLFGDLLREAEKVYGFDHQGCIHVPCRLSEFEDVQTRICAASGYDR
ncbi:hypothetical protein R6Q59_011213 [Mikania micrantha]